jgi:hypothetical protein
MSWTAPTVADVLSEFTPAEKLAVESIQGDVTAANLTAILARVVAEIRDYIRSGGYALDATATTLPLGLHNDCISIARWRYVNSVPALGKLRSDDRKKSNDDAMEKMGKIAAQKFAVEPPTSATGSGARSGNWNTENKVVGRAHPVPRPGNQFQGGAGRYANPDAPEDKTTAS